MEQERTEGGKIITGNGMVGIEVAPEPRWFLITHDCGAIFTMNMEKVIDSLEGKTLLCPGCFTAIKDDVIISENNSTLSPGVTEQKLLDYFKHFCKTYNTLIKELKRQKFTIREIGPDEVEDINLPIEHRESYFKDSDLS